MEGTAITRMAKAGSVESNDILIMIQPGNGKLELELESVVEKQFGDDIKNTILETLKEEGVTDASIIAKDKGALDFTIKARVRACVRRGSMKDEL